MNKIFKYETHLHTSQGSKCADSTGADMVDFYKRLGYSGFVVTDHFMNGNTAVDLTLDWDKQVDEFCKGYEAAKLRGDEVDFDVFFGFEFNYKGTEFLIYGLDKEWLKNNEIIIHVSLEKALKIIRNGGGTVIHAHPFRKAPYIEVTRLIPECTDAVEVRNGGNCYRSGGDKQDKLAELYADIHGKPKTAGTDIHSVVYTPKMLGGVTTQFRVKSIYELANAISGGECSLIWDDCL